jgi:ADP-ribose pyrophosphatase
MANEKKAAKAAESTVEPKLKQEKKKAKPVGKAPKASKAKKAKKSKASEPAAEERAQLVSSETVFQGPLFRVQHDKLIEPGGKPSERDVIRHNGSVVILAIDSSKSKKDPWVVIERQYRHAANQYLWELPAGKLELAEETGYSAKKWKPLVEYFASPGFLGEAMKVFTAEGLVAGDAHPEADEDIDFRLVKLSDLLKMIDKGAIKDGKTLTAVLLYARQAGSKRGK